MNQLRKNWTTAWHAILDREFGPEKGVDIEKRFTEPDCDFRMHFKTWQLPDAALRECFSMLPKGNELADRLLNPEAWDTACIISKDEAAAMLRKAISDLADYAELECEASNPIRFLRGAEDVIDALHADDAIHYEAISEGLWDSVSASMSEEENEAYRFIYETLYRRKSVIEGIYYTFWPYAKAPQGFDPTPNLLRMKLSNIKFLHDDDGLIVFYKDDEAINDTAAVTLQLEGRGLQEVSGQIIAGLEGCLAHHKKRGFPEARFNDYKIGLGGSGPFRFVIRPMASPQTADEGELPYTGWNEVLNGALQLKEGYGLFFDAEKDRLHTKDIEVSVHIKSGKRQRDAKE